MVLAGESSYVRLHFVSWNVKSKDKKSISNDIRKLSTEGDQG